MHFMVSFYHLCLLLHSLPLQAPASEGCPPSSRVVGQQRTREEYLYLVSPLALREGESLCQESPSAELCALYLPGLALVACPMPCELPSSMLVSGGEKEFFVFLSDCNGCRLGRKRGVCVSVCEKGGEKQPSFFAPSLALCEGRVLAPPCAVQVLGLLPENFNSCL